MVSSVIERARRHRDDPAPDDARLDRDGPRVACSSARTPRASATCSRSPATRPRSATTRARAASTRSTRSACVELMARLNSGEDFNGRPIDAPTSFLIGVAVNPTADDLDVELDRYRRKIEAGAQFAMTQLVFDLDAPRQLPRAAGRPLADSGARRHLPDLELPLRAAAATTSFRGSSCPRACRRRCATPAPTRPRSAWPTRRSSTPQPREGGGRLPGRAVPAAAERARAHLLGGFGGIALRRLGAMAIPRQGRREAQ